MHRIPTHPLLVAGLALLVAWPARGEDVRPPDALVVPDPVPLSWAIEQALERSPAIDGHEAMRDRADARIGPAGAWDDPRFTYEASNLPVGDISFDRTPLSGHQLALRQKLPFPGLLGNRRDAARADHRATGDELVQSRLAVRADVERAWSELGFAQRALDVTDRNLTLLRGLIETAEARYRVGEGLQQDVLRTQLELTTRLEERLQREAAVTRAAARFAALLDLPPDVAIGRTTSLEDATPIPEIGPILEQLTVRSPVLRALAARIEAAERRSRAAQLAGYPDVDLGIGYRIRRDVTGDPVNGEDFLSAGVTIRLPVDRSRWRGEVAEARAEARRWRAEQRAVQRDLEARARAAYAELVRADAQARLIRTGLLPQAEQSLASTRSAYEVGRVDILGLLDSQVRLLDAQLEHVRALADRRVAYANLELIHGEPLR